MYVFMNKEYGNIHLTMKDAVQEAQDLYDYGDPTNGITFEEYYEVVEVK